MAKILKAARFGNPVLRQVARRLNVHEIKSSETRALIENMRHTLKTKKYGVGMAAPQIGVSVALSIIAIKPTPTRPELKPFDMAIFNPEIVEVYGKKVQMWEGCISCGTGKDTLFAKVPRYKKIKLRWDDEQGERHEEVIDSFVAHVAQHEVDHLNGIVFVDRVKDTSTYMMADEYRKRVVQPALRQRNLME